MTTPFEVVEPVFQDLFRRVWADGSWKVERLRSLTPADRAIYATRVVEGQIDNGGVSAVFYNAIDDLIPDAIEGYRLLDLEEHAWLLTELLASRLEVQSSDAAADAFDSRWFALRGAEIARAQLIGDRLGS